MSVSSEIITHLSSIAVISSLVIGCDLFTLRKPEEPEGGGSNNWRYPSTPSVVLDNLTNAVTRRSPSDYMRCFTSNDNTQYPFLFQPDPQTEVDHPGFFDRWDWAREEKFAQTLFSSSSIPLDSIVSFRFFLDRQGEWGDTATVTGHYVSHIGHIRPEVPRQIEGWVEWKMVQQEGLGWAIYLWVDRRSGDKPCWSDLKALF